MDDVSFLRVLPIFRTLNPEEAERLLAGAERRTYDPMTRIVRRGDPGDSMFVIRSGAVQVPVVDADGERRLTAYLGPGDCFGEMALLTGEPRGADVIADGDVPCTCLVFSKPVVEELLRTKPRVARFLTEIVGRRLRESGQMRQVGKYEILGEIGKGGAAIVFEGLHPTLHRSVAIKMLSHELVYEQDFARRFLDEARIVAELRHDNIVQVYDQEAAFATFFIVMERLSGRELSRLLKDGPLSFEKTSDVLEQVCRGLAYAHRRGVVHRDIKPSNIFVEETGRVKVMDFGIAIIGPRGEEASDEGVMGTPGFIAPEALRGQAVDQRADIYALGVVAYMMLAGHSPFTHKDKREVLRRQLSAAYLDVTAEVPNAPARLASFIRRATAHDPADRFQNSDEALAFLEGRAPRAEDGHVAMDVALRFPPAERARVEALLARLKNDLEQTVPGAEVDVKEPV